MERIRYQPGEAIRWLETGSSEGMDTAKRKGKSLVRREGERTIGKDLKDAAGAMLGLGRSALAQLAKKQAEATEYSLYEDSFELASTGSATRSIPYKDVTKISWRSNDRVTVELDRGHIVIKPVAHLVAGKLRVPIGWLRNGLEVPFETLAEELAAHCRLDIEHAS